tara:strand:+ start:4228 stop:4641 length:414 start_codon:yes stop_codon:yes gene_type:complete
MINRIDDSKTYLVDSLQIVTAFFVIVCGLKLIENKDRTKEDDLAQTLIEQANKWYNICQQDKHTFYSMQHANYAVAYLHAARHIESDTNLERLTGVDIHKFYKKLDEYQRLQTKEIMSKAYPKSKIKPPHAQAAWLT